MPLSSQAIHDDGGYRDLRQLLASQYNIGDMEPNVQVVNVDLKGDRSMTLQHNQFSRRPMSRSTDEVLKHVYRLWKFPVQLNSVCDGEAVQSYRMPALARSESDAA